MEYLVIQRGQNALGEVAQTEEEAAKSALEFYPDLKFDSYFDPINEEPTSCPVVMIDSDDPEWEDYANQFD